MGSGSILQQVIAAQALLAEKFGVAAEIYSAPSWPELRRDALKVDRWNRLHPAETPLVPYVSGVLGKNGGPIIAASDWMKALPDLLRPWIDAPFVTLGTDGFGRSDTRESLRAYFEIDAAEHRRRGPRRAGEGRRHHRRGGREGDRRPGHRP